MQQTRGSTSAPELARPLGRRGCCHGLCLRLRCCRLDRVLHGTRRRVPSGLQRWRSPDLPRLVLGVSNQSEELLVSCTVCPQTLPVRATVLEMAVVARRIARELRQRAPVHHDSDLDNRRRERDRLWRCVGSVVERSARSSHWMRRVWLQPRRAVDRSGMSRVWCRSEAVMPR